MDLYLVRHAEPKSEFEDRERPLTEKGWADIGKIADFVGSKIKINSINHSPKTRARQTAQALAERLNPPEGIKEVAGLKPLDSPSIWAEKLAGEEEDTMLVGHLPHMSRLSSLLLSHNKNKPTIEFPAGGMVCLSKNESGVWIIRWVVNPQILPA